MSDTATQPEQGEDVIGLPALGVELTAQEAGLIFSAFEQIPLTGPDTKEVAASIQRKLLPLLNLVS